MDNLLPKIIGEFLTYDDVLLVPGFSEVLPRDISLSKNIYPLIVNFPSFDECMQCLSSSFFTFAVSIKIL